MGSLLRWTSLSVGVLLLLLSVSAITLGRFDNRGIAEFVQVNIVYDQANEVKVDHV